MNPDRYSFFALDQRDGYVIATLNRPEFENMWSGEEDHELDQLVGDVIKDNDVRALVLTGAGEHFSGGIRLTDNPFADLGLIGRYDRCVRIFGAFTRMTKPLIIALNGPATGTGLTLAMFGDIVIAERHVKFSDAHVLVDTVSATGAFLWPPTIGLLRAKRYLLTGDAMSAEDAERFGLVSEVVDRGESLARATEYAARIASLPPNGVQGTKRALNQWLASNFSTILEHGLSLEFMAFPKRQPVLPELKVET